jgi:hypothetical protein
VIPAAASGSPWDKAELKFIAREKGVQYDRFGAVWIGNVEVLRTTTAEPTANGILWSTVKDISIYKDYIRKTDDLYTFVTIPNNVDSTYTGVISVTVELTVTLSSEEEDSSEIIIYPLTNATQGISYLQLPHRFYY